MSSRSALTRLRECDRRGLARIESQGKFQGERRPVCATIYLDPRGRPDLDHTRGLRVRFDEFGPHRTGDHDPRVQPREKLQLTDPREVEQRSRVRERPASRRRASPSISLVADLSKLTLKVVDIIPDHRHTMRATELDERYSADVQRTRRCRRGQLRASESLQDQQRERLVGERVGTRTRRNLRGDFDDDLQRSHDRQYTGPKTR
jgi:hypothetical protein